MKNFFGYMIALGIGFLFFNLVNLTEAQSSYTEQKLIASDGTAQDSFGQFVSIFDEIALIGAHFDDPSGNDSGSVYVLRWSDTTWIEEQKLIPSDGSSDDNFGNAVAASDGIIVVGAYRDDDKGNNSGSAYVFRWNGLTWIQEQKLTASNGASGDRFGYTVAISGNIILIGSPQNDARGQEAGSVYVFRWNGTNWQEEAILTASDGAGGDFFGYSVALSNDAFIVGSYGDDDKGSNSGSAYIYQWDGSNWVEEQKLTANDGTANDAFGLSVSISGDKALVGAYYDSVNGTASGSAYVYHYNSSSWIEKQKLTAPDASTGDQFGYAVAIADDRILIGAYADDDHGSDSGSVYIFDWDGSLWTQDEKIAASDGAAGDYFGAGVAISGTVAMVGSHADDDNGGNSGSVYFYLNTAVSTPTLTPTLLPPTTTPTATFTPTPTPTPLSGDIFVESPQYMSNRPSQSVALGDLDSDGDIDAVVGNVLDSSNRVWLNLGNGIFIDIGQNLFNNGTDVALGDLDNDGDLDALFIRDGGGASLKVWRNNGDGTFTSGPTFGTGSNYRALTIGDIDNDADLDVIATGSINTHVWINNGNASFSLSSGQFAGTNPLVGTQVALGDIDNDTDLDLVIVYSDGNTSVWRNENGNFSTLVQQLGLRNDVVSMGDLNNDGHLDIFEGGNNSKVWLNNGNGTFSNTQSINALNGKNMALEDLDMDGDLDAISLATYGFNAIWLNDGTGTFADSGERLHSLGVLGVGAIALADVDGDTDLDVFSVHSTTSDGSPNKVWFNQLLMPSVNCGL